VLEEEDGVGLLLVDLHVREEHLQGGLVRDLGVLPLERVDQDSLSTRVLHRSPSYGTFQSVMIERSRARSNCEFTPNPPQQRLTHPNINYNLKLSSITHLLPARIARPPFPCIAFRLSSIIASPGKVNNQDRRARLMNIRTIISNL
jgi:hypothetical protein